MPDGGASLPGAVSLSLEPIRALAGGKSGATALGSGALSGDIKLLVRMVRKWSLAALHVLVVCPPALGCCQRRRTVLPLGCNRLCAVMTTNSE